MLGRFGPACLRARPRRSLSTFVEHEAALVFFRSSGAQRENRERKAQTASVFFMNVLLLPTNASPREPPPVPQSELPNQQ
jgi:hypothetical protein